MGRAAHNCSRHPVRQANSTTLMSLFRDNRCENKNGRWDLTESQRWMILDYFWEDDACISFPSCGGTKSRVRTRLPRTDAEWDGGVEENYVVWNELFSDGTVVQCKCHGKYPAVGLSLSEQHCVRPLAWTTVKKKIKKLFKHNDSWNSSSENAAKCQAFGKQQFGRGNEDTSRRTISVCVESWVRWGGY